MYSSIIILHALFFFPSLLSLHPSPRVLLFIFLYLSSGSLCFQSHLFYLMLVLSPMGNQEDRKTNIWNTDLLPGRDQRVVCFFSVFPLPLSLTAWSNFSSLLIILSDWVVSLLIKRFVNEHSAFLSLRPLSSHRSAPPELIGTFSAGVQFSPLILRRMAFRALFRVLSALTPVSQPLHPLPLLLIPGLGNLPSAGLWLCRLLTCHGQHFPCTCSGGVRWRIPENSGLPMLIV